MRRLHSLCSRTAFAILLGAVWLSSSRAKADVTLFDADGWTFRTSGLVAAHYQLIMGDADPKNSKTLIGGRIQDEGLSGNSNTNKLVMSDIRSGFIGTQMGFGLSRQISPTVRVDSFLAANVNGINSNRGQDTVAPKAVDYREAWAQVETPYGSVKFGRMFGLFASGSAAVVAMAYQYGVGHPCAVNASTIACGSVGAGPLYAGFDAAIRYTSPRIAGFQLQLAVVDPDVTSKEKMSPLPRVDAEINYDQTFGGARVRLIGQSMVNRIENSQNMTVTAKTIWAAMGTALVDIGALSIGGGGWTGKGIGERVPLEAADPSNPLFEDQNGVLRQQAGFYGNVQVNYMDNSLTVGGGELLVKLTDLDLSMQTPSLTLTDQYEGHVTLNHKFGGCLVVNVEYMRWHTDWQNDPTSPAGTPNQQQTLNFMGAGMNYIW
ncbi:MAG TPA: porin [Polyangia bacterium]|nr:porin [Polyangia bacterium]